MMLRKQSFYLSRFVPSPRVLARLELNSDRSTRAIASKEYSIFAEYQDVLNSLHGESAKEAVLISLIRQAQRFYLLSQVPTI